MNDFVYILLPVHNRREITKGFIDCLSVQTNQDYHLLLIDDGSTDGTEDMVREKIANLTVLKGKGNWWWAGGLQQGINWLKKNNCSNANIVLMINDDVSFDPYFFEKAVSILNNMKKSLLLAQLINKKTGETQESGIKANLPRQQFQVALNPKEINCLSTRGLFLRFSDLLEIGDFYPHILPHYGSDYEFTIRAHRKGFNLCTTPELAICPDANQTGFHEISADNFSDYLSKYFSKKSVRNPFYRSNFIFLTAPKKSILRLIIIVWITTFSEIFKQFCYSLCKRK